MRFRTVTPVWIDRWLWNDTLSLKQPRSGALLFFRIICQISRSHRTKSVDFDPNLAFPDCDSSLNWPMAMKWSSKEQVLQIPFTYVLYTCKKISYIKRVSVKTYSLQWNNCLCTQSSLASFACIPNLFSECLTACQLINKKSFPI